MLKKLLIITSCWILALAAACTKKESGSGLIDPGPKPGADTSLKAFVPFHFGAAVSVNLLKNNSKYKALVTKEFKSITAENAMKFQSLHPDQGTFNWSDADYLVSYAVQNNIRVHGHTLIWHNSLPAWVTGFAGDSAAWENMFKTHIQTVVAHFKGKVGSWDVVNEAVADDGSLRNTIWLQKLGPGYIARAFQYAHEADNTALLFYNDYGHEYGNTKRTAILDLVNKLKTTGIPIHGIGLQMHTRYNQTENNWAIAINTAQQTGLKVHISELDICMNPDNNANLVFNSLLDGQQALKYKYIVSAYNKIPEQQKFGITTWNVTDADSWIPGYYKRPDWPLPFDANYKPKAAYKAIIEAVK